MSAKDKNEKQSTDSAISEDSSASGESSQVSHGTIIDVLEVLECGGNTRAGKVVFDPIPFPTGGSVTMC